MILELNEHWGIFYDEDVLWFPYCRKHEEPGMFLIKYCGCIVPQEIWDKALFMDKLDKFK